MSKRDLEEYWRRRDTIVSPDGPHDYLQQKAVLDAELAKTDPLALRCVNYARALLTDEAKAAADPQGMIQRLMAVVHLQPKASYDLYDSLKDLTELMRNYEPSGGTAPPRKKKEHERNQDDG